MCYFEKFATPLCNPNVCDTIDLLRTTPIKPAESRGGLDTHIKGRTANGQKCPQWAWAIHAKFVVRLCVILSTSKL